MENESQFRPGGLTVGAIYRQAQIENKEKSVECGDLTHDIMKGLVDDLNQAIISDPLRGKPFYIRIMEKKDLAMPRMIHRDLYIVAFRPYPEADSLVFWADPSSNTVKFCWCLPANYEMDNMLNNPDLYDHDMLTQIKAWKRHDLYAFGFRKNMEGNWEENPHYAYDVVMELKPEASKIISGFTYLNQN